MMGHQCRSESLFYYFRIEALAKVGPAKLSVERKE
jgi:hypothetical protein